jgi:hypothetical protein
VPKKPRALIQLCLFVQTAEVGPNTGSQSLTSPSLQPLKVWSLRQNRGGSDIREMDLSSSDVADILEPVRVQASATHPRNLSCQLASASALMAEATSIGLLRLELGEQIVATALPNWLSAPSPIRHR